MKRLAAVLVVLIPALWFVAGCGGGGGTNPPKSLKPEEMKPPEFTKKFEKPPAPGGQSKQLFAQA